MDELLEALSRPGVASPEGGSSAAAGTCWPTPLDVTVVVVVASVRVAAEDELTDDVRAAGRLDEVLDAATPTPYKSPFHDIDYERCTHHEPRLLGAP